MRRSRQGLVSLEAPVLINEETSEVPGFEKGLDASQGVRAGDLPPPPEDSSPYTTMTLGLLQGVEASQSRDKHDEERQDDFA